MSLLPVDEALSRVLDACVALPARRVPMQAAPELVLADVVIATGDRPAAAVSTMDGYAVRSDDLAASPVGLRRVGESAAGHPFSGAVPSGCCVRISTGAVVPADCDVVVPQEDTRIEGDVVHVDLDAFGEVRPGRWIRAAGSDIACGQRVLEPGTRLGPGELAAAASAGRTHVMVHRRPGVALVSTGDELVPIGAAVGPGRITSTNAMMLAAQVARAGGTAHDLGIAPDDPERLTAVLRGAVASHDVLVTTGGASVGDHDLVPHVLESLGCRFVFAGIALRPGKPTAYGQLGHTHVFVLPGNPASALVTFELLVRPALRRLQGVRGDVRPRTLPVRLRNAAPGAGRRAHYVRAQLHGDGSATVLDDQVSGSLGSIRDFDALVVVPVGSVGLTAEATADAIVVDPWWHERRSS